MQRLFILLLALTIFTTAGYADMTRSTPKSPLLIAPPSTGAANEIMVITTVVGKTITIKLDSNPTTGYSWQLAQPLNTKMIKLIASKYQRPDTKLIGAGGKEIWTFKALKAGETTIVLKYVRPWEKGVAPVKTRTFTISVKK